ncbi:MAG: CHAT domain-containing protein [Candidatus Xenobiia bacterium LiM19]
MKRKQYILFLLICCLFFSVLTPSYPAPQKEKSRELLEKASRLLSSSLYRECISALDECEKAARDGGNRNILIESLLLRSRYYLELQQMDNARASALQAASAAEQSGDSNGFFESQLLLSATYRLKDRWEKACSIFEKAEKLHTASLPVPLQIDYFIERGNLRRECDDFDRAGKNYDEALRLSIQIHDRERESIVKYHQAMLLLAMDKYKEAEELCTDSIEEALNIGRPYLIGLFLEADSRIKAENPQGDNGRKSIIAALSLYQALGNQGKTGRLYIRLAGSNLNEAKWDKAQILFEKALQAYAEPPDAFGTINACRSMLSIMVLSGGREKAPQIFATLRTTGAHASDPDDRALALLEEGRLRSKLAGAAKDAVTCLLEAENAYKALNDHRGETRCLVERAMLLTSKGQYEEALTVYKKALEISETLKVLPEAADEISFTQLSPGAINRNMAMLHTVQSQFIEALEYYEKALKADSGADRIKNRIQDRCGIINICYSTLDLQRLNQELACALSEVDQLSGVEIRASNYHLILNSLLSGDIGRGMNEIGESYTIKDMLSSQIIQKIFQDQSQVGKILSGYREWLDLCKKRKDIFGEGVAQMLMGYFYLTGLKYGEAHNSFRESYAIFRKAKTPLFEGIVLFMDTLVLKEEDRKKEAVTQLEEAVQCFRSDGSIDNQVSLINYLGVLRRETGDSVQAIDDFKRSLALLAKQPKALLSSATLMQLGYSYYQLKEYKESERYYREALSLLSKTGNSRNRAYIQAFIGRNLAAQGSPEAAVQFYRDALENCRKSNIVLLERDIALEIGEILTKSGKESEALKLYLETIEHMSKVHETLSASMLKARNEHGKHTRELFERAVSLLIKKGEFDDALKYFEMSESYDMLSTIDFSSLSIQDEKMRGLITKMTELKNKMGLIEQSLEKDADRKRADYLSGVLASTRQDFFQTINEIRKRNPDYEQLLAVQGADLAELQPYIPESALLLEYYPSKNGLYIFVVTRDSFSIKFVDLPRERLYELVHSFRNALMHKGDREYESTLEKNSALLYRYLISPVISEIDKKSALTIIPGGLLWYIPFDALTNDEGKALVEKKSVRYLYSSHILKMSLSRKDDLRDEKHFVGFGNPEGSDLPSSASEVEHIGSLFSSRSIFIGDKATKESLQHQAPSATILHIAAHSVLDSENVNKSYIQLAGRDGKLSLGEIYGLSLPRTDLVVLSSCDSAVGEGNPGREFASLASAFTIAGSHSVIASLWRVEDSSTEQLFQEFYKNLKSGCSKVEALRLAKCTIRQNASTVSPFYWAGFILLGEEQ